MSIPIIIALAFAFAVIIGWSVHLYRRQEQIIASLAREKAKILIEEKRVFDFLHGLGEALADESKPNNLHSLIVEGAIRILEAQGGALYLLDPSRTQLRPVYVSKNCLPFMKLPKSFGATTLQSQIRLQAVKVGETVIGEVWSRKKVFLLNGEDERFINARAYGMNSALLAALDYGGQNLGVLAVCRNGEAEPFGQELLHTFQALAEQSAFSLFDAILHQVAAEKRQLDRDIQIANEVQRILLPSEAPLLDGFEISGTNVPARDLSGDYFDFLPLDTDRFGVVIADVSGKGVPAALIMAMARSALRLLAPGGDTPVEIMRRLNAQLYPDIKEGMFMSMVYLVLDRRSGDVSFTRGGHDAPLIWKAKDGSVVKAASKPGLAVGIDSGSAFNRVTAGFSLSLEPGDCLVLYTDGITEALNRQGDEFGFERMIQSIRASAPSGAAGIIQRVTADVQAFIGNFPQHDDITLIAIRKT